MQYDYPQYSGFRCVACNIAFNNFDDQKKHYFAYHSRNVNTVPSVFPAFPTKTRVNANKAPAIEMKCDACNLSCSSQASYDMHVNGRRHAKSINKLTQAFEGNLPAVIQTQKIAQASEISFNGNQPKTELLSSCLDCGVNCVNEEQMVTHFNGKTHQRKLKIKMFNELKEQKDPSVYCINCDKYLMPDLMKLHMEGGKHKRKCKEISSIEPEKKKKKTDPLPTTINLCGYCQVEFNKPEDAVIHFQSKLHLSKRHNYKKITEYECQNCELYLDNQEMLDTHLKGFKHYVRVNRGNPCPEGEFSEKLLKMREKMKSISSKKPRKSIKSEIEAPNLSLVSVVNNGDEVPI